MDESLPDEYSTWGYRLFFDREPESESAIKVRSGLFKSTRALRLHFLSSEEYLLKNGELSPYYYIGLLPKMEVFTDIEPEQQSQLVSRVQKTWEELGESDPHWSVISQASFRSDRIEGNEKEFFESAKVDKQILDSTFERNGLKYSQFKTCREFGCGVGRVTRYLSEVFEQVDALDISSRHLAIAEKMLGDAGIENVSLHHIETPEALSRLPKVDFLFSVMVLQHNPPPVMKLLLGKLIESLEPNGVAMIQIPTYKSTYTFDVESYIESPPDKDELEMHYLPQNEVFDVIDKSNCQAIEVIQDNYIGRNARELSNTFLIRKKERLFTRLIRRLFSREKTAQSFSPQRLRDSNRND